MSCSLALLGEQNWAVHAEMGQFVEDIFTTKGRLATDVAAMPTESRTRIGMLTPSLQLFSFNPRLNIGSA